MMSRITNYEAVADYFGHWLHRAQCPTLLTGESSVKSSENTPPPNHEDKETSPNGRNATPRRFTE